MAARKVKRDLERREVLKGLLSLKAVEVEMRDISKEAATAAKEASALNRAAAKATVEVEQARRAVVLLEKPDKVLRDVPACFGQDAPGHPENKG